MMHLRLSLVLLALLVLPVAARAQKPELDADAKEILAYNLTMPVFRQILVATRNMAEAAKQHPKYARAMRLEAEIDALEKKIEDTEEPSEADLARLEKLRAEEEALEDSDTSLNISEVKTLSDMDAMIRKEPLMANALKSAGLTPREYAKFMLAFFQAGMIHGMQKSGTIKEIPKDLQATVNMENVKFIQQNEAEIERMWKEIEALGKKQ